MSDELFIKNCLEKYSLAPQKNDVKEELIKLKNYLVRTHHDNKKKLSYQEMEAVLQSLAMLQSILQNKAA